MDIKETCFGFRFPSFLSSQVKRGLYEQKALGSILSTKNKRDFSSSARPKPCSQQDFLMGRLRNKVAPLLPISSWS
jgi:alpha/beta superfamily hydrolase